MSDAEIVAAVAEHLHRMEARINQRFEQLKKVGSIALKNDWTKSKVGLITLRNSSIR